MSLCSSRGVALPNFVLQLDPITVSSSTTDKQDATFRIGF